MVHEADAGEIPVARLDTVPKGLVPTIAVLIGIGAIAFFAALATDVERAWQAYLVNWLFFTGVAQGAVMLAVVVTIAKGAWSRHMRRIALSFVAFLPISLLLLVPLLYSADYVFPWTHEPVVGKEAYLNVPFLVTRQLVLLGLLFGLSILFARYALRPDLGLLRGRADDRLAPTYERATRNWQGQEAEEAIAHRRLSRLSPALALVYAFAFGVVAWDFIMSLEPHWFSTLIGPFFFMAAFLGGLAATGIATLWVTRRLDVAHVIAPSEYHDLGKLTFGFVVFWAYLFFSQYIVIWYGLLPGEQSFVIHRFTPPFGAVAVTVFLGMFVIPFFGLLGAAPKRSPRTLTAFGWLILVALWLERYLLVYPSYNIGAADAPLGWQEVGIAALFAGLLILSITWFLRRYPVFQLWQPMSELELGGIEVEVEETAASAGY